MKRALVVATSAAALAVLPASCGEEFATNDDDGQGGSGASATASTGRGGGGPTCEGFGDACTNCIADACPEYACPCWQNAACTGIYSCYDDLCPDGVTNPCSKYCFSTNAAGISLAVLTGDCAVTRCAAECGTMMGTPLTECQHCIYESCASPMNACLSTAVCYDYLACANACGDDADCLNNCATNFPAGVTQANAVADCAALDCPSCG